MDHKDKELISVAASVAAGCEYCTGFHVKAARDAGATHAELERYVKLALDVRERATARMSSVAWKELGRAEGAPACDCSEPPSALEALAMAASALAANCGSGVRPFLDAAVKAGADENQCEVAVALARKIRKVAGERADAEVKPGSSCCADAKAGSSCCSAAC